MVKHTQTGILSLHCKPSSPHSYVTRWNYITVNVIAGNSASASNKQVKEYQINTLSQVTNWENKANIDVNVTKFCELCFLTITVLWRLILSFKSLALQISRNSINYLAISTCRTLLIRIRDIIHYEIVGKLTLIGLWLIVQIKHI